MAVFITRTRIVSVPFARAAETFLGPPSLWLPLSDSAPDAGDGESYTVSLGRHGVAAEIDVSFRPRCAGAGAACLAMRWSSRTARSLFPVLDADLELSPSGRRSSRLTLTGSYRPPLGIVGAAVDGMLLHHVAEQDVEHFLALVAARLEAAARARVAVASAAAARVRVRAS